MPDLQELLQQLREIQRETGAVREKLDEDKSNLHKELWRRMNSEASRNSGMPMLEPKANYEYAPWRSYILEKHLPEAEEGPESRFRSKWKKGWRPDATNLSDLARYAHHEQSETTMNDAGKWTNVYGGNTPQAGQPLPLQHEYESPEYDDVQSAVEAASLRSIMEGQKNEFMRSLPGRR
jgi:hypothetical protein